MKTALTIIGINVLISMAVYLLIAFVLIVINGKAEIKATDGGLSFAELKTDYSGLPQLETYSCRDGSELGYRSYPADSDKVLILLHGSGWHSSYFLPLAASISADNQAYVYTPNLRGHGPSPERRGDIDYIDQLTDDIADFIGVIRDRHPGAKLIIGGHSSGGGLALRVAESAFGSIPDAYLFLSPYMKYNAPTMRADSGGWASTHMPRIIGLTMLNNIGIRVLNGLEIIDFNMPAAYRDGTETLTYSFRLNTGYAPANYKKALAAIKQKALVIVGECDESFIPEAYEPDIAKYNENIRVLIIDRLSHMGIVTDKAVPPVIAAFLEEL